jgi:lipopolysaccharide transport system permease protein
MDVNLTISEVLEPELPSVGSADGRPLNSATPGTGNNAMSSFRIVIEPSRGWQLINVAELWQYRELIFFLAWRDVKVRYKQTALGAAWAILQPAAMMAVFYVFFGRLAGVFTGGIPGPLFYLSGLLPWFFFSTAVTSAANSVVASERLITKIYFPRLSVPFASVAAAAVDFLVASALLAIVIAAYGVVPNWNLLFAPLIVAIITVLAAGLGTLLSALNVMYRDFRYVIPFAIQIGMFATPTIYMQLTGNEGRLVEFLRVANPMTSLVAGFRASVIGGPIPWDGIFISAAVAVLTLTVGCLYFRKVEDQLADII